MVLIPVFGPILIPEINHEHTDVIWEQHAGGSQVNIWANHFDGSTWGTAERIENSNNRTINPQIAMDGAGNAIAVWEEQIDIGHRNVWANHFDG